MRVIDRILRRLESVSLCGIVESLPALAVSMFARCFAEFGCTIVETKEPIKDACPKTGVRRSMFVKGKPLQDFVEFAHG